MPVGGLPPDSWTSISIDVQDMLAIHGSILSARTKFQAAGLPALALRAAAAYDIFNSGLRALAITVAADSEKYIKEHIEKTRVRPPTGKAQGLADNVKSDWWQPTVSVAVGWVAIAELGELDKTINPVNTSKEPYWKVQEYGFQYDHLPQGFFFGTGGGGAGFRPDAAQSRLHPVFRPSPKGGVFSHPPQLEARHFLRDGAAQAMVEWRAGFGRLNAAAIASMRGLLVP